MKNSIKKLFALGGVFLMGMSLASCGISKNDADKINKAVEDDKPMSYEDLKKSYGDPTYDFTAELPVVGRNGVVIWVKGCATKEKVEEKWEKGEKLQALSVLITASKAASATWIEDFNESDAK